jgi:hypothetical protein
MENNQAWNLATGKPPLYNPSYSTPTTSVNWQLLDQLVAPEFGLADGKWAVPTTFYYQQKQPSQLQYNADEVQQSRARSSLFSSESTLTSHAFDGGILLCEPPPILLDDTDHHICVEVVSHRDSWLPDGITFEPPSPYISSSTLLSRRFNALTESSVDWIARDDNTLFMTHKTEELLSGIPPGASAPQMQLQGIADSASFVVAGVRAAPVRLCQGDECQADLTQAKRYYKRRRLCGNCIGAHFVSVGGVECRYCQQCSCLHNIAEFDKGRKSCRMKLEKHKLRARRARSSYSDFAAKRPSYTADSASGSSTPNPFGTIRRPARRTDPGHEFQQSREL